VVVLGGSNDEAAKLICAYFSVFPAPTFVSPRERQQFWETLKD
jgi:hypothetical protein